MAQFNVGSADEFLEIILTPLYKEFVKKNSSIPKAVSAIVMAYHLYEWANKEKFTEKDFKSRYPNDQALSTYFEIARNIANGIKHNLERLETRQQSGFSSSFSNSFARPLVIVRTGNQNDLSVDELLKRIVDFWCRQQAAGWPN